VSWGAGGFVVRGHARLERLIKMHQHAIGRRQVSLETYGRGKKVERGRERLEAKGEKESACLEGVVEVDKTDGECENRGSRLFVGGERYQGYESKLRPTESKRGNIGGGLTI
jgi:hypothetical protein